MDGGGQSWYAEAIQCHSCEHVFLIGEMSEWIWEQASSIFENEWDTEADISSQLIKELIKNGKTNDGKTLQEHINNFANIVKGKKASEL
jgi:hypothetical protein